MTNEDRVVQRLGGRVAYLREQAGIKTKEELGDRVGLSQQTISDIELGKREIKPHEFGRFARAFEITTDELVAYLFKGVGYTGEPIIVTGAGKANTERRGTRG